jgi:D-sedoheptulose 7-phosphate isomerase
MNENVFAHRDELVSHFQKLSYTEWFNACKTLRDAYEEGKVVWIAGNGGNAANAHHFATDWNKGLFKLTGQPLRSHTLWDNPALVSAFANDQEFSTIFSDQLKMLASPGDVLVLLTGGGTSQNILQAAKFGKNMGLTTIGLTGGSGKEVGHLFDFHIHIPSFNIQVVEDIHASFGHSVMKFILQKHSYPL